MGQRQSCEVKTNLKVENKTDSNFTIYVNGLNGNEWRGSRPDYNFSGIIIHSNSSITKEEVVYRWSSQSVFTMKLNFEDGTEDNFSINQKFALGEPPKFNHFYKNHDIFFKRINDDTLVLSVYNTQNQLLDQRAKKSNKEGEQALQLKNYSLAKNKFQNALTMATNASTKSIIQKNIETANREEKKKKVRDDRYNQRAQNAFQIAEEALIQNNFGKAIKFYEQASNLSVDDSLAREAEAKMNTAMQRKAKNDRAKDLNKEGEEAMKMKKFETARAKFEDALTLAVDTVLVQKIKSNRSVNLSDYARELYRKAWQLEEDETEDKSEEAMEKFQKSKEIYQSLNNSFVHVIDMKISANDFYNKALKYEAEASKLYENETKNYAAIKQKYDMALQMYREALQKFKEGLRNDQMFASSVKFVKEQIKSLESKIESVQEEELKANIGKVTVQNNTNQVTNHHHDEEVHFDAK